METYNIVVTENAERLLRGISNYIEYSLGSRQAAINTLTALKKGIENLDIMPERNPLVEIEPWREFGYRKMSVKNFLVYYYVQGDSVVVAGVVYGRSDQAKMLENMISD